MVLLLGTNQTHVFFFFFSFLPLRVFPCKYGALRVAGIGKGLAKANLQWTAGV